MCLIHVWNLLSLDHVIAPEYKVLSWPTNREVYKETKSGYLACNWWVKFWWINEEAVTTGQITTSCPWCPKTVEICWSLRSQFDAPRPQMMWMTLCFVNWKHTSRDGKSVYDCKCDEKLECACVLYCCQCYGYRIFLIFSFPLLLDKETQCDTYLNPCSEFILNFLDIIYSQMTPFRKQSFLLRLEPLSFRLCLIQ